MLGKTKCKAKRPTQYNVDLACKILSAQDNPKITYLACKPDFDPQVTHQDHLPKAGWRAMVGSNSLKPKR
jgi:hypothetical protein